MTKIYIGKKLTNERLLEVNKVLTLTCGKYLKIYTFESNKNIYLYLFDKETDLHYQSHKQAKFKNYRELNVYLWGMLEFYNISNMGLTK